MREARESSMRLARAIVVNALAVYAFVSQERLYDAMLFRCAHVTGHVNECNPLIDEPDNFPCRDIPLQDVSLPSTESPTMTSPPHTSWSAGGRPAGSSAGVAWDPWLRRPLLCGNYGKLQTLGCPMNLPILQKHYYTSTQPHCTCT